MSPSWRDHHDQGKHLAPANENPPGTTRNHRKFPEIESHVPEPGPSMPPPRVVVVSPSSPESGKSVADTPDLAPATRQQKHGEPPSLVDNPGGASESLGILLLKVFHEPADGRGVRFWTLPILKRIATFQRVVRALESSRIPTHRAEQIAMTILQPPEPRKVSYIKIFCILELCVKTDSIENFLCPKNGVCDDDLPLVRTSTDKGMAFQKRNKKGELLCFNMWHPGSMDSFGNYQYQFCPHIFSITDKTKAPHFDLEPAIILPFTSPGEETRKPLPGDDRIGAFGEVFKYHIPPECHDFNEIVTKLHIKEGGVYAVKKLHRGKVNDWKAFKHETDQLQRFNGHANPHIVTLLATYSQHGEHYFVFPFAEGDLCNYWATQLPPERMNSAFTRWYAGQLSGLIEAISSIHFPEYLQLDQAKFGRHGDIKPDNILWFKSTSHAQGLFVVSDLGLSALNSDKSRSNIPGEHVPPVPGYRPPECDIEEAKVSRLFDVWTMGCLYLEMITWYLGGEELRRKFEKHRTTSFLITGAKTNQFYNLAQSAEGKGMFVQFIKPEVINWMNQLQGHPACTDFVHDIIDIIARNMIVILADPPKRASSRELKLLFRDVREKCNRSERYCVVPTPRPIPKFLNDAEEGVCVKLNKSMGHHMSSLYTDSNMPGIFKGTELKSAGPRQYQDV